MLDEQVIDEPDRDESGRLLYYEDQLQRWSAYRGPLRDMPIDKAREMLRELHRYFDVGCGLDMPLPPAGLPGNLHTNYSHDEQAAELIAIGLSYQSAIVYNERRSMHNRWKEARAFIHKVARSAEEDVWERIRAEERSRAEENTRLVHEKRDSSPMPKVYFIGTQTGPIKIGIAINPANRLKGLQTSHHERLSILVTCDGDIELERQYHKRFAEHRLSGEWFERCPEILEEIERLQKEMA